MSQDRWLEWCKGHQLDVSAARFAVETCYYRRGRSRPGTLLLTTEAIIHHSYSWKDTLLAVGEPSVRVTLPLREVAAVRRKRMSWLVRLRQTFPEALFEVSLTDHTSHDLILHRGSKEFEEALTGLGMRVQPQALAL
jgi:hypothetical protein